MCMDAADVIQNTFSFSKQSGSEVFSPYSQGICYVILESVTVPGVYQSLYFCAWKWIITMSYWNRSLDIFIIHSKQKKLVPVGDS